MSIGHVTVHNLGRPNIQYTHPQTHTHLQIKVTHFSAVGCWPHYPTVPSVTMPPLHQPHFSAVCLPLSARTVMDEKEMTASWSGPLICHHPGFNTRPQLHGICPFPSSLGPSLPLRAQQPNGSSSCACIVREFCTQFSGEIWAINLMQPATKQNQMKIVLLLWTFGLAHTHVHGSTCTQIHVPFARATHMTMHLCIL